MATYIQPNKIRTFNINKIKHRTHVVTKVYDHQDAIAQRFISLSPINASLFSGLTEK